jgi:hypothetical protein
MNSETVLLFNKKGFSSKGLLLVETLKKIAIEVSSGLGL